MSSNGPTLFDLLPALYRLKDAQLAQSQNGFSDADAAELLALRSLAGPLTAAQQQQLMQLTALSRGPLQSLLTLIEEQLAVVRENLAQLYDDLFIETCAPWVIPYIGELIGYQPVHGVAPAVASPRAEVAHTISFRRRKGTILALEQLARDVTGWGAHAVEFFKLLATTQYMKHIRVDNYYAPDLRGWRPRAYMDTGFDATAHKVDVRRVASGRGRYNIQNVGIFLWSLNAYSLTMSPAVPVAAATTPCFRFNPLGCDAPLFTNPVSQGPDITAPAGPANVADVLLRRLLCSDIQGITTTAAQAVYYGGGLSLALYLNGSFVDPAHIQVCNLSGDDGHWINQPSAGSSYSAAIDPELGRIALPPPASGAKTPQVQATFYYGFNAEMGGGEYSRAASFSASPEQVIVRVPGDFATIHEALGSLAGNGVVEITDNGQYSEPNGLTIKVTPGGHIELRAADGFRPTLVLGTEISVTGGEESQFDLNGLLVTYAPPSSAATPPPALIHAPDLGSGQPQLSHLGLTHLTLVPGWALTPQGDPLPAYSGKPTVLAEAPGLEMVVQNSIVGGLWINGQATTSLSDSIVDATAPSLVAYVAAVDPSTQEPQPGGALTIQGCTVVGRVYASVLSLVSDSIFWATLPHGSCSPVTPKGVPFASVYYTTPANEAGDMLVVGKPNPGIQQLIESIPVPSELNQHICASMELAPGLSSNAYVPTPAERAGDFSRFAASLHDPSPGSPFPISGGIIPPERWGDVFAWRISSASPDPWVAPVWARRKQEGCVRFSFLPAGSITPRNFECVIGGEGQPQPLFYSLRYCTPAYCKLLPSTDDRIHRGADDGGEMGAFHFVLAPMRETDLRVRIQEFLPVGLEFGIFYQN